MEYNSGREKLILPEYGRNIQKMVNFAKTVEDKEERNKVVNAIIKLMGMMNPHLRDVDDYNHKLWDHVFMLADFELDVECPYPVPKRESFESRPDIVPYPKGKAKYGHYGKIVQDMVAITEKCTDKEAQKGHAVETMNLMKRFYTQWNGETIYDTTIFKDFNKLCSKDLEIDFSDVKLAEAKPAPRTQNKKYKKGGSTGSKGSKSNSKTHKKRRY